MIIPPAPAASTERWRGSKTILLMQPKNSFHPKWALELAGLSCHWSLWRGFSLSWRIAQVGGHDKYCFLTLVICQSALTKQLKHDGQDFWVSLVQLIKEDHRLLVLLEPFGELTIMTSRVETWEIKVVQRKFHIPLQNVFFSFFHQKKIQKTKNVSHKKLEMEKWCQILWKARENEFTIRF